jgi:hypothetical protein
MNWHSVRRYTISTAGPTLLYHSVEISCAHFGSQFRGSHLARGKCTRCGKRPGKTAELSEFLCHSEEPNYLFVVLSVSKSRCCNWKDLILANRIGSQNLQVWAKRIIQIYQLILHHTHCICELHPIKSVFTHTTQNTR